MGMFDKMLGVMHIDGDDEDEEYYEDEEDFEDEDASSSKGFGLFHRSSADDDEEEEYEAPKHAPAKKSNKITSMNSRKRGSSNMEVCVIKPTSFEDSREIIETLLSDRPVILNMEGLDLGLAQRIIDITSGACLAISGTLQKISSYIFIITPNSVDISGDLAAIMDGMDFSGLQSGL